MLRAKDGEVAPVESGDPCDIQAFRHCHDAAVYDVEFRARIILRDFAHALQIVCKQRRELGTHFCQVAEKCLYAGVTQVASEQVADFGQNDVGDE